MKIAATVVRTNNDSPKIDCAGVEAGSKILVGLTECPVESANTDQGPQTNSVQVSNLMCEPLMRSEPPDSSSVVHAGFQKRVQYAGVARRTPWRLVVNRESQKTPAQKSRGANSAP